MSGRTTARRCSLAALFAALFMFAGTRPAQAQGFISPFIGYNFGGDAGCPAITNCQDRRADSGVSLGALGSIVGDVRYYHAFHALDFVNRPSLPVSLGGQKLDYGRAAVGLILKF